MERRAQADSLSLNAKLLAGCTGSQGGAKRNQSEAKTRARPAAESSQPTAARRPAPSNSSAIELSGQRDAAGRLALNAADSEVVISAPSCEPTRQDPTACSGDVEVSLMRHGGREQVLRPDALYVDSDATLFRGTLYQRDKTKSHAVVIADVNGDARKDVSLGTGRMGGYGSPSYDVFVYVAGTDSAVRSRPFSALTPGGLGLFELDDGKLRLQAKSGCCIHSAALYAV